MTLLADIDFAQLHPAVQVAIVLVVGLWLFLIFRRL